MPSIFIFGLFPEDSGKTVFSSALARGFVNSGIRACVFKPRSGHSLWHQYDAFLKCREAGRLFCEDIIKLRKACRSRMPFEVLNPIDALMAPLNASRFIEHKTVNQLYIFEEDVFLHLVAERYTICKDDELRNILCVNRRVEESNIALNDPEYLEGLKRRADKIIYLHNSDDWSRTFEDYGSEAIMSCYGRISGEYSHIIVEGYNDAVCPGGELRYDLVVGVAPGAAIFYDADEFHKILEIHKSLGKNPTALRAKDIIKYLRGRIMPIPPLPSSHLKDYDLLSRDLSHLVDLALNSVGD